MSRIESARLHVAAWFLAIAAWLAGDTRPKTTPVAPGGGAKTIRPSRYALCHEHATIVVTPRVGPSEGLQWEVKTSQRLAFDWKTRSLTIDLCYAEMSEFAYWMGDGWAKMPADVTVTWVFPGRKPVTDVFQGVTFETVAVKSAKGQVVEAVLGGFFESLAMAWVTPEGTPPLPGQLKADRQMKIAALTEAWPDFKLTVRHASGDGAAADKIVYATVTIDGKPHELSVACEVEDVGAATDKLLDLVSVQLLGNSRSASVITTRTWAARAKTRPKATLPASAAGKPTTRGQRLDALLVVWPTFMLERMYLDGSGQVRVVASFYIDGLRHEIFAQVPNEQVEDATDAVIAASLADASARA